MASKNTSSNKPRSYSSVAGQATSQHTGPAPTPATSATASTGNTSNSKKPLQLMNEALKAMSQNEVNLNRNAFRFRMQSLTGKEVTVERVDGSRVVGILHTAVLYLQLQKKAVVVKAAKVYNKTGELSDSIQPGSTLIIDYGDVISLQGKVTDVPVRARGGDFETDSNIKKHGDMSHLHGRELQSVSNSWLDAAHETSLESAASNWDQFETNKRLFNVRSTFDENLYTKKLDLNAITPEQKARAERLAKEIEGTASANIHLAEERGHQIQTDYDEEARFSGVIRDEGKSNGGKAPQGGENVWKRGVRLFDPATGQPQAASGAASAPAAQQQKASKMAPPPGNLTPQLSPIQQQHVTNSREGAKETTSQPSESTPAAEVGAAAAATPAPAPAATAAATAAATTTESPAVEKPKEETAKAAEAPAEGEKAKKEFKFNLNAPEFKFNLNAPEFKPPVKSMPAPTAPPAAQFPASQASNMKPQAHHTMHNVPPPMMPPAPVVINPPAVAAHTGNSPVMTAQFPPSPMMDYPNPYMQMGMNMGVNMGGVSAVYGYPQEMYFPMEMQPMYPSHYYYAAPQHHYMQPNQGQPFPGRGNKPHGHMNNNRGGDRRNNNPNRKFGGQMHSHYGQPYDQGNAAGAPSHAEDSKSGGDMPALAPVEEPNGK